MTFQSVELIEMDILDKIYKNEIFRKQDQGSIAPLAVHPITFHNVQVFFNMSTVAGTRV